MRGEGDASFPPFGIPHANLFRRFATASCAGNKYSVSLLLEGYVVGLIFADLDGNLHSLARIFWKR